MKLSEAMLKGIGDTVQTRVGYIDRHNNGRCAIACVLVGAFGVTNWDDLFDPTKGDTFKLIRETYPELDKRMEPPENTIPPGFGWDVIVRLNDNTEWTREQIAEWLRSKGL
jgi:hypothetical protein